MEDLSARIDQFLSDPESIRQLQSVISALGAGEEPAERQLFEAPPAPFPMGGISPELLGTITRLAPLLSAAEQEDDVIRLLQALRPLLEEARQKRVDEALGILRVLRLLPLLQENGLLSGAGLPAFPRAGENAGGELLFALLYLLL